MAQEPSDDIMAFSPRPQPGLLDPSNRSELPEERNTASDTTLTEYNNFMFFLKYIVLPLALLIGLFGMVGNGTVIWEFGFRVKRNPFLVYILNLAIADFTFLLSLDAWVTSRVFLDNNDEMIEFFISLFVMTNTAGLFLLMAISTERCLSVTFPIWYKCHRPAHLSTTMCALIWGLSLCLGVLWYLCDSHDSMYYIYDTLWWVYSVLYFPTLLVLCVSSLTLLIRVHCCSRRRQVTKLYRVILLTVLAFLLLGLPLSLSNLIYTISYRLDDIFRYFFQISRLLAALNSAVNPVIYFFVGRQGQRPGRRALRELLQSVLTEDTS